MATHRNEQERLHDRKLVLYTAARMFLEKGYEAASVRQIASAAGINVNTMVHDFGAKENILCELVEYVLDGQFSAAKHLLLGMTIVHDFSFFKSMAMAVLILLGMFVIAFVIFVMLSLSQNLLNFVVQIFNEVTMR